MTDPIDWTKPLRVVGTHEEIACTVTDGKSYRFVVLSSGGGFKVDNDGCTLEKTKQDPLGQRAVENIPHEPRIVERWCLAIPGELGRYLIAGVTRETRPAVDELSGGVRIARVLIEETD